MSPRDRPLVALSDLRTAAYCLRQLYYRRREDDRTPPDRVAAIRALAHEYPSLVDAADAELAAAPVAVPPAAYRARLRRLRAREVWSAVTDPCDRDVLLAGRDCRGVVHKVLDEPLRPSVVSPGAPPDEGVWHPQTVHAVAAAKVLSWDRGQPVETAVVEYPAHGVVRTVRLTTRKRAAYRRTLRAVRALDGPPPRLHDRKKCGACEYRAECGVRTRTLASLLG